MPECNSPSLSTHVMLREVHKSGWLVHFHVLEKCFGHWWMMIISFRAVNSRFLRSHSDAWRVNYDRMKASDWLLKDDVLEQIIWGFLVSFFFSPTCWHFIHFPPVVCCHPVRNDGIYLTWLFITYCENPDISFMFHCSFRLANQTVRSVQVIRVIRI